MEKIDWVERTGVKGGWPLVKKTYWEGRRGEERVCWITPLSNGEWLLTAPCGPGHISYRSTDCEELKKLATKNF